VAAVDSSSVKFSIGVSPEQPQSSLARALSDSWLDNSDMGDAAVGCSNTTSKTGFADAAVLVGWVVTSAAKAGACASSVDARSAGQVRNISVALFMIHTT
jgi:hypothetical protein